MASKFRPYTFTGIHVVDDETAFFAAVDDEWAEQKIDHALILRQKVSDWAHKSIDTAVAGSWALDGGARLVNVGVDGNVIVFEFPGSTVEVVDASDRGPSHLVTLRAVAMIGGKIHIAGMARMVYRRDGEDQWTSIDGGTFVPREERETAAGFLALDGHSASEVYAAGYRGEIWSYNGSVWERHESPTNIALTTMTIAPDGAVHIAGLTGLYIIGRGSSWRVLDHGQHEDDFWGMTTFKGSVYSSTLNGIFRYNGAGLDPVATGLEGDAATAYLDARGGVLWSAGYKTLARTSDGMTWTQVAPP